MHDDPAPPEKDRREDHLRGPVFLLLLVAIIIWWAFPYSRQNAGAAAKKRQLAAELTQYSLLRYEGHKVQDPGKLLPPAFSSNAEKVAAMRRGALSAALEIPSVANSAATEIVPKLSVGRYWSRPLRAACDTSTCPCLVPLPCFEPCSNTKDCPAISPSENTSEQGLANAVQFELGRSDRMIAFRPPINLLVLLDLSGSMLLGGRDPSAGIDLSNGGQTIRSALAAVGGLAKRFNSEARELDQFWVLGFSEHPEENKLLGPFSAGSRPLSDLIDALKPPDRSTLPSDLQTGLESIVASGLLPRRSSHADAAGALHLAAETLMHTWSYAMAENHIALVTDGLFDCQRTVDLQTGLRCAGTPYSGCASVQCGGGSNPAESPYTAHLLALRELVEQELPLLMSASIHVDVFLGGSAVAPHSLLIPHPDRNEKRCLTAAEARERNFPEAGWQPFFPPERDLNRDLFEKVLAGESGLTYVQPNGYLALVARATHGAWAPLRSPCPALPAGGGGRDISGNGIIGDLDDYCAAARTGRDFDSIPAIIPSGSESLGADFVLHNSDLVEHGILDGEGRLICDPSHLNYSDQAQSMVAALFDALRPEVVHEVQQHGP